MMHSIFFACLSIASIIMSTTSIAEPVLLEDFRSTPELRWEYIGDNLKGGMFGSCVEFMSENGEAALKLSDTTSSESRGGFIQTRTPLATELPNTAQGI